MERRPRPASIKQLLRRKNLTIRDLVKPDELHALLRLIAENRDIVDVVVIYRLGDGNTEVRTTLPAYEMLAELELARTIVTNEILYPEDEEEKKQKC